MAYTPSYTKPYADGFKNKPNETTPITADVMNGYDSAIETIETYLEDNPIEGGGTTVVANPTLSGTEDSLEGLQVGDTKYKVAGGSGNANIWYGTHAEYEAQSSTIADDTQVCFTDDIGLEAGSEYYSETEQIIGTYLGKPLYRICLNGNIALNSGSTSLGLTDEINVINFGGFIKVYSQNIIYNGYSSSSAYFNLHFSKNENLYKLYHPSQTNDATYSIVIEYTKTTDSTVGVINGIRNGDNYSTTERVVGTWIDGKIIYQKTYNFGQLPNNETKTVDLDMSTSSIEQIWIYDAIIRSNNTSATLSNANPTILASAWYFNVSNLTGTIPRITCVTGADRSGYSAYITIRYTKTAD